MISDLILYGRLEHSLKAQFPIFVTLVGILMLVSDLQPQKAPNSIFVTLSGILILTSELQDSVFTTDYYSIFYR